MDEVNKKQMVDKRKLTMTFVIVLVTAAVFTTIGYVAGKNDPIQTTLTTDTTDLTTETAVTTATDTTVASATTTTATTTDETANWKTYTNDEYGFSFKYPGDWTITNNNPGRTGSVNYNLTIGGPDSENFQLWVNPDGFGFENASDFYKTEILNGKIMVNSKEPDSSGAVGQVFTSPMTSSNVSYVLAYNFGLTNRISELEKFDQILSTFQFTK